MRYQTILRAAIGLIGTCALLVIASLSAPQWATCSNLNQREERFGLFAVWRCTTQQGTETCNFVTTHSILAPDYPNAMTATILAAVFLVITLVVLAVELLLMLLLLFPRLNRCNLDSRNVMLAILALSFLVAIALCLVVITYPVLFDIHSSTDQHCNASFGFGAAYWLNIATSVLNLVTMAFVFHALRTRHVQYIHMQRQSSTGAFVFNGQNGVQSATDDTTV